MARRYIAAVTLIVAAAFLLCSCAHVAQDPADDATAADTHGFYIRLVFCGRVVDEGLATEWRFENTGDYVSMKLNGTYYLVHTRNVIIFTNENR